MRAFRHLYGPVQSRRLGRSLGLDLLVPKTCCFDCIYCQQGRTTRKTLKRAEYVPADEVVAELESFAVEWRGQLDYVTLSGSGEPTLNSAMREVLRAAKRLSLAPVCVLTNGATLVLPDVRADLLEADLVVPTLTTAKEETFQRIHRPVGGLRLADVVAGWK